MPVHNLNGIDIHSQILWDEGPLIFMCHGLVSGSIATWYFQFAPTLAKRYRVVLYDMRGHGKSEKTRLGFDVPTMAKDLAAIIRYYQIELGLEDDPVHLVGHSYGALVALHYACHHQELGGSEIGSMAIVDAPLPAAKFIYPGMKDIKNNGEIENLADTLMEYLELKGPRRRNNFKRHVKPLYLDSSLISDVENSIDIDDEILASLHMPVPSVYGKYSDCRDVGNRLERVLPNSQSKTLPCGHFITVEEPDLLAKEINEFYGVCA